MSDRNPITSSGNDNTNEDGDTGDGDTGDGDTGDKNKEDRDMVYILWMKMLHNLIIHSIKYI